MNIDKLKQQIDEARSAYYNSGTSSMSDKEYDEMVALYESLTGDIIPVGAEINGSLPEERHEFPAKSLDKTKNVEKLVGTFPGKSVLMWKLDGLTTQITYEDGKPVKAATRGNGEVGQSIMDRIQLIHDIPLTIPVSGKCVVRGECVMSYPDFNAINKHIETLGEEPYKNPRNLAAGTLLALNKELLSARPIHFRPFSLVYYDEMETLPTFSSRLNFLREAGFKPVRYSSCETPDELRRQIKEYTKVAETGYEIPVDGLVVADDAAHETDNLPGTGHHPNVRCGYALKWADETSETTLRDIEWSPSRTGLLNPVAVFDTVELEGTAVSRASLHNVSYIETHNLAIGDKITIYKANKIIPQLDKNLSMADHSQVTWNQVICPCCGNMGEAVSRKNAEAIVKEMWCKNPYCPAKQIGAFVHFAERDCMNIKGLSEQTIEKLVNAGYLKTFSDFYKLSSHAEEIAKWDGFGTKAVNNMLAAIETSKKTDFVSFVHALGIPNIGKGQAKLLQKRFKDVKTLFFVDHTFNEIESIDGIGHILSQSLLNWIGNNAYKDDFTELVNMLTFESNIPVADAVLAGKTFVITGTLEHYPNRDALVAEIESLGGKVAGSVSKNTSYLINNDVNSTSGKNKKAQELGVPIISEVDYIAMK